MMTMAADFTSIGGNKRKKWKRKLFFSFLIVKSISIKEKSKGGRSYYFNPTTFDDQWHGQTLGAKHLVIYHHYLQHLPSCFRCYYKLLWGHLLQWMMGRGWWGGGYTKRFISQQCFVVIFLLLLLLKNFPIKKFLNK